MYLCIYNVYVPPTTCNAFQGLDRSKYPKSRSCPLELGHHQTPAQETSDKSNNILKKTLLSYSSNAQVRYNSVT